MRWSSTPIESKHFEIEHDIGVGFYLYVFENNRCISDFLQDSLELAKEYAWEKFEVPKNSWKNE